MTRSWWCSSIIPLFPFCYAWNSLHYMLNVYMNENVNRGDPASETAENIVSG